MIKPEVVTPPPRRRSARIELLKIALLATLLGLQIVRLVKHTSYESMPPIAPPNVIDATDGTTLTPSMGSAWTPTLIPDGLSCVRYDIMRTIPGINHDLHLTGYRP